MAPKTDKTYNYNEKIETHVLVMGKSGVGKSSLLNYMFGKEVERTGNGKPVTPCGIFDHEYRYAEDFTIHIHDSWGLEENHAEEWKEIMIKELQARDHESIKEWFNTIIYCTSLEQNRFQEFEINTIRELLKTKNNVIVVITWCDNEKDERAVRLRDITICKETGLSKEDIIFASSVEKNTIGGNKTKRFGKDKIFELIIRNLWRTFKEKLPNIVRENLKESVELTKSSLEGKIKKKHFVFKGTGYIGDFEKELNAEIGKFIALRIEEINKRFEEAYGYYDALSRRYCEVGIFIDAEKMKENPDLAVNLKSQFEKKVGKLLHSHIERIMKINRELFKDEASFTRVRDLFADVKMHIIDSFKVKKSLIEEVTTVMNNIYKALEDNISKIEDYIVSLKPEEQYLQYLNENKQQE